MMNIDSPMGSQVTYFQTKPHSPGGWWERFGFQKPLVSPRNLLVSIGVPHQASFLDEFWGSPFSELTT